MNKTLSEALFLAAALAMGGLSLAWLWEAETCGRCFISTRLAPLIALGSVGMAAWTLIRLWNRPKKART